MISEKLECQMVFNHSIDDSGITTPVPSQLSIHVRMFTFHTENKFRYLAASFKLLKMVQKLT